MRVVVADDSVLFREGLVRVLDGAGFEVTGQVSNAEELFQHIECGSVDVAIVDIRMPPTHSTEGLVAAQRIRERYPRVAVLVLSQYVETHYAMRLLATGATSTGYLLKDRVLDLVTFIEAVRRVSRGELVIDPSVVSELIDRQQAHNPVDELSHRERDVLTLMAEGRSNQSISDTLCISPKTVEAHIRSIFTKFNLSPTSDDHRRVLAVLTFLRS